MPRRIKRKRIKMPSKTLAIKKASFAVPKARPLTEKDFLLNLSDEEVKKLGKETQRALREYKEGKTRPIEELFEELRRGRGA